MNILPKKRWHVRTRDNINRVRRDEAKAAEEEREKERRIEVADREARLKLLRTKARANRGTSPPPSETSLPSTSFDHVNFFKELERGETTKNSNEENTLEKKREQEEWEKKVGILTYLGGEGVSEQAWWEKGRPPIEEDGVKDSSRKDTCDPLKDIRGYLGAYGVKRLADETVDSHPKKIRHSSSKKKKSVKKKKSKKSHKKKRISSSSDSDNDEALERAKKRETLERLRRERLEREKRERIRESRVLNGLSPDPSPEESTSKTTKEEASHRKYNSQFNPEIARQNKLNSKTKYWLE